METFKKKENINQGTNEYKDKVHWVLSYSYSFYLLMFLVGIFLDFLFPIKIFKSPTAVLVGLFFLFLATIIILWAQATSRNLKKETLTKKTFSKGPYRITRSPTHWGLFFLIFGFGFTINAFFLIISSIISLIVTKLFFLKKEELLLEKKYGEPYQSYKKSVKL